MSFVSFTFLAFLAAVFLLYYLIPKRFQWMLLLAASLVFYAFAGPTYLIYMAVTILSTWGAAYAMDRVWTRQDEYLKDNKELSREDKKAYKAAQKKKARLFLALCLILNLGILAVIKYTGFVLQNINNIFGTQIRILRFALPLGISFYMFQSLGYVIDVYRRKYPAEKNLAKCALFTSFFPQLIQGPISRFDYLSRTLYGQHDFDGRQFAFGFWRVLWGFFKKLVIADRLAPVVVTLTGKAENYPGVFVLGTILFYGLQIYGDFTGGIDITIGVAQMLGIKVTENFDRPFFSKNIAEYWRRWHITMGTWFKDYIFYPLSVSQGMIKLSKWSREKLGPQIGKRLPVYISTILVWLATGIWHGAAWHFIVWGLLNCVVILISQELAPLYRRFHERFAFSNTRAWDVFQVFRTFWLMGMIRVLDVYKDVPTTFKMLGTIFTTPNWGKLFDGSFLKLGISGADYLVVLFGTLVMFFVSLAKGKGDVREMLAEKPAVPRYICIWLLLAAVLVFGAYGIGYDAAQFIYNQF
ncbi:MAG: MBOAT family protein [Firmicutes bacterium]|nr:MBOAT family protein [Bacillota bacterium]